MRLIRTFALVSSLVVCQPGAIATAIAANSDPPQPAQTAPQSDCRTAGVAPKPSGAADVSANSCGQDAASWRFVQREPGFWIPDAAAGFARNTAEPQPTVLRAVDPPASAGASACMSYPLPVVVGGQQQQATIVACPQPDGTWQVTQYTPGLPPQVYSVPAPPAGGAAPSDYTSPGDHGSSSYSPDWGWGGVPWFWGFVPAIASAQKFHGFSHPFGHGFGHGFNHGFAHSFAHGFAAGHGGFTAGHGSFGSRMHR